MKLHGCKALVDITRKGQVWVSTVDGQIVEDLLRERWAA